MPPTPMSKDHTATLLAVRKDLKLLAELALNSSASPNDHLNLIFQSLAKIEDAVGEDVSVEEYLR